MITLALVGYGRWGKHYITTAQKLSHARIKYVCTSDTTLNKEYITVKDYKDLVKFADIDGVIIATPATTHYKIATYFLKKGYNLLIEKPFVTRLTDAQRIESLANRTDSIVMVGHIHLYNPAFQAFKESLSKVGKLSYLDFEGFGWGPIRKDISALWDWAPHDISMAIDLLGYPSSVQAWGVGTREKNSFVVASLLYSNGVKVFIKIGWAGIKKTRKTTGIGDKGGLVFDDRAKKKVYFIDGNNLEIKHFLPYKTTTPLFEELTQFIACINERRQPITGVTNSLQIVRIIAALEKSLNCNGKITKA